MPRIILVRHAQASLGKSNYDALSPLGMRQAEVLGEYIYRAGWEPQRIISGSLNRHQQTAQAIAKGLASPIPLETNPNWNEFDFSALIKCYLSTNPEQTPQSGDVRAFFSILKKSMLAWSEQQLAVEEHAEPQQRGLQEVQKPESWEAFSRRVSDAILQTHATHRDTEPHAEQPTIVVSSGGAIAMLLMQILGVNARTMIELNFQIKNTSFTEILVKPHKQSLVAFNQMNHLSDKQYHDWQTFA